MKKSSAQSFECFRTIRLAGAVSVAVGLCLGFSEASAQDCDIQPVSEAANTTLATQSNFTCLTAKLTAALSRIESLEAELAPFRNAKGAVVAFERSERSGGACPTGWSLFREAGGRMIVGAGQHSNQGLRTYPSYLDNPNGAIGGEERVQLKAIELPNHRHNIYQGDYPSLPGAKKDGSGTNVLTQVSPTAGTYTKTTERPDGTIIAEGANNAHNNMPPYIALYFCKKN